MGPEPWDTLTSLAETLGIASPTIPDETVSAGEVWTWSPKSGRSPLRIRTIEPRTEHLRHRRKYAEGDLGEARSFYFRGPGDKLNLRAQNLLLFMQIADGLDDETWMFHLRRGDYSHWFAENIKDPDLAGAAEQIEQDMSLSPRASRDKMSAAILDRYTAPA